MSRNIQKLSRHLIQPINNGISASSCSTSSSFSFNETQNAENRGKYRWLKIAGGVTFLSGISLYALNRNEDYFGTRLTVFAKKKKQEVMFSLKK